MNDDPLSQYRKIIEGRETGELLYKEGCLELWDIQKLISTLWGKPESRSPFLYILNTKDKVLFAVGVPTYCKTVDEAIYCLKHPNE